MVNTLVERATSDRLIGPDLAVNIQISDICNHDHTQAKEVLRAIKKRLGSKKPRVQLLALTLLEAIVKNGVDTVHMHVAEKDLPREMVKLMRKRPDFNVKEKILTLIDTWQESFGGPGARYPQYFVAYQDLLRLGEVFPRRPEKLAQNVAPPQSNPLTSCPGNLCIPKSSSYASDSSVEDEFPTLSLTEIQNARGALDVLTEMLNAIAPGNKEGVKQEVIVDLVEQCRTYKQRVVHFINSSSDESLLCQGLALNDDLRCVLAKHESIVSGATSSQLEKSKPKTDTPLIDTGDIKLSDGSTLNTCSGAHSLLLGSPTTNGQSTTLIRADPKIDLLSGDDFNSPTAKSLALVPVGDSQPVSHVESQQNAHAFLDMHSPSINGQSKNSIGQASPSSPRYQQQPDFQSPQSSSHPNASVSDPMTSQHDQSFYPRQESLSPVYGAESNDVDVFPPPPWETQLDNSESVVSPSQEMQINQAVVAHTQPLPSGTYLPGSLTEANGQAIGMYSQPVTAMPSNQMSSTYQQSMQYGYMGYYVHPQQIYGNHIGYGYDYAQGQQQNAQFLEQSRSGLHVRDDTAMINSSYSSNPSYVPFGKASKPEDKLFGDLVKDFSTLKPTKRGGSM